MSTREYVLVMRSPSCGPCGQSVELAQPQFPRGENSIHSSPRCEEKAWNSTNCMCPADWSCCN